MTAEAPTSTDTHIAKQDQPASAPKRTTAATRLMLFAGVVAGPLFLATVLIQMLTRAGFDPVKHPLSLLSLGDLGWIQITNFILAGVLVLASAIGLRRKLTGEVAGTWGPILFGLYGVSFLVGGVFVADPAFGYPVGTPDSAPDPTSWSWHGTLHSFAAPLMAISLIAAFLVFARRFGRSRQRGLQIGSWAAVAAYLGLFAASMAVSNFWYMLAGGGVVFLWASIITAHVLKSRATVDKV